MKKQAIDATNAAFHRPGALDKHHVRYNGPFKAGDTVQGERHFIDHLTYIKQGGFKVFTENVVTGERGEIEVDADDVYLEIPKDVRHRFEVYRDGAEWRCIFAADAYLAAYGEHSADYHGAVAEHV